MLPASNVFVIAAEQRVDSQSTDQQVATTATLESIGGRVADQLVVACAADGVLEPADDRQIGGLGSSEIDEYVFVVARVIQRVLAVAAVKLRRSSCDDASDAKDIVHGTTIDFQVLHSLQRDGRLVCADRRSSASPDTAAT